MTRMITVRYMGEKRGKLVPLEEAEGILEKVYNDPIGGIVADAKTRTVIWNIGPDIEEILIMEQMLGGG